MSPIAVALVEDERHIREGLAALIRGTPGYRVAGAYGSVEEAMGGLRRAPAEVLLLDIHLPGLTGTEGVGLLREKFPETQVLMLTIHDQEDGIFEALCNGASGYLLKNTRPARLLEAIREVREGGAPMSPEIARKVVSLFRKTAPREPVSASISPQETRLLQLLAEGHRYQDAADEMHISIHTVRNHIRSVYEKLHVHSKSEAVSRAIKSRLI